MKYLYKYPQSAYPYGDIVNSNRRSRNDPEYELIDTGVNELDSFIPVGMTVAVDNHPKQFPIIENRARGLILDLSLIPLRVDQSPICPLAFPKDDNSWKETAMKSMPPNPELTKKVAASLKKSTLFQSMDQALLQDIAAKASLVQVEPGEFLTREGEKPEESIAQRISGEFGSESRSRV